MRRTGAVLALLAVSVAVPGVTPPVTAQTPRLVAPDERAAALAAPAVVYVETFWGGVVSDESGTKFNDGKAFEFSSSCTGFVVNPAGVIVTAGHCVDDSAAFGGIKRDLIEIAAQEAFEQGRYEGSPSLEELRAFGLANWTVEGPTQGSPVRREVFVQRGRAVAGERSGRALWARVVDFRSAEAGDVALLNVESRDLPAVLVSNLDELTVGAPLASIGYPGVTEDADEAELEATSEAGAITAKKSNGRVPVYEVSAAIASGMSGGPSVDMEGEVIGVNSFGIGDREAFNLIVPAGNIREILARNGATNELGRIDEMYREGLAALYAGRYTAAVAAFDRVIELDPEHRQAQKYRRTVAQAGADDGRRDSGSSEGPDGEFPLVPAAIGAVALVGLGGGAFAWKSRNRPRG